MSAPSPVELRKAAKYYRELGWQVLPASGKQPRVPWKSPPKWEDIEHLLTDPGTTGLGVVLGSQSGNLVVRDFDEASSYVRWCERFPELARSAPHGADTATGVSRLWPNVGALGDRDSR